MKSQCDGLRSINHASKLCASGISGTIVLDIVGDEERWTALREVSRLHPVVEPVGALKHLPFSVYSDWNRSVTGEKVARPHDASTDLSGCLCIAAEPEEVAHSLPTCSDCELCDLEKSEAVPFPFLALSREEEDVKIKREKVFSSQPSIGGRSRQDTFSWKAQILLSVSPVSRALQRGTIALLWEARLCSLAMDSDYSRVGVAAPGGYLMR